MTNGSDRMDRIEAALQRITERHEALAQTVEIIAAMQREGEKRVARLETLMGQTIEAQRKNETLMGQALEAINSLARIAQSHERRLDDLERQ